MTISKTLKYYTYVNVKLEFHSCQLYLLDTLIDISSSTTVVRVAYLPTHLWKEMSTTCFYDNYR